MLIIQNIRTGLDCTAQQACEKARRILGVESGDVKECHVHKLSVDARRQDPRFVYSVAAELCSAELEKELAQQNSAVRLHEKQELPQLIPKNKPKAPIVVCGMGPAGIFAGLELARAGLAVIIIEQGPDIEERSRAVLNFEKTGQLNSLANIQFGEGGAGTFSDGKLVSRIGSPLKSRVLESLVAAGAPREILFMAKPHIGTDLLRKVFVNLREQFIELGGRVMFNTKLCGFESSKGKITAIKTNNGVIECSELVLATGHSARDTYSILPKAGFQLEGKPFSAGFRIEHLQAEIDKSLYHAAAGNPALPAGEYSLAEKIAGHGVYTFCMCPGGSVVAAASEEGRVVVNGMSSHARNGKNANSAVVAEVAPFNEPLQAVAFQRRLEEQAFIAGGGAFAAPAQSVGCFLQGKVGLKIKNVAPSYPRGVNEADLGALLPEKLTESLRQGLVKFGKKLSAFRNENAVLTGLETRTSAPLRILRNEGLQAEGFEGVWPCGEGAGYAGGISSAAVDGIKVARAICEKYDA